MGKKKKPTNDLWAFCSQRVTPEMALEGAVGLLGWAEESPERQISLPALA